MIFADHLIQCLAEISHKRTADTAGIHLVDLDPGILQEATVDADLTKFILDQYEFFTLIGFTDHFFDQGSFACTQKSGENINSSHNKILSVSFIFLYYIISYIRRQVIFYFLQKNCHRVLRNISDAFQ